MSKGLSIFLMLIAVILLVPFVILNNIANVLYIKSQLFDTVSKFRRLEK